MSSIDSKELRTALGAFATGVTVVTARDPRGAPIAMTANSFSSVSLEPPLVLWSVNRAHDIADAFIEADHYAAHVLTHDQEDFANHFAGERTDKFDGIAYDTGLHGLPLLRDCCARFLCRTEQRYDGGDHVILLGRVLDMDVNAQEPLVFHGGKYRRLT